ncbi:sensor histidine kinase [Rhodohalobacter sp.]|uniref:sensor histidine kinase n=1 Tax=Rhodohalobacter sp. TaxID=1974210 RepID=UPI002ACD94F7|nr:sensor histidine kinase [Rhodohalobacter sp.]MDZ7755383.1 sensor histidine kinase [Rhodohalobacter sp.]
MNFKAEKLFPLTTLLLLFLLSSTLFAQSVSDSISTYDQIRADGNGDGQPDLLGEKVITTGIANSPSGLFHEQYLQLFIQDDSSGISIFSYNIDDPIVPGDSLMVWGAVDSYNGLIEVQADSYRVYQNRSTLRPLHLTDIIANPADYLGVLAKGDGVITDKGSTYNGKYVIISPETSPDSIMVYVSNFHVRFSEFNFDVLSVGDKIAAEGVITEYNPEFPGQKNYKLFLRTPDDLNYIGLPSYYVSLIIWSVLALAAILFGIYLFMRYRVETKTKDIQLSLDQKEMLLKEVHHRVKNSLSIVSGLIEMQSLSTENEEANRILQTSQTRIQSIALIHDKLYKSDSLSDIKLDVYLKDLVESLHNTFTELNNRVSLQFEMDSVEIDSKSVIYCGLLVNELVVNSFKHAFKNRADGELTVKLKKDGNNIILTVTDNGPGLPDTFNPKNQDGLGSMLINTFAANLEAEMTVSEPNRGGASFTFTFPHKS